MNSARAEFLGPHLAIYPSIMILRALAFATLCCVIPVSYASTIRCETAAINTTSYSGDDKVVSQIAQRLGVWPEAGSTLPSSQSLLLIDKQVTTADLARVPANSAGVALIPELPTVSLEAKLAILDGAIAAIHPGGEVRAYGLTRTELVEFFNHLQIQFGADVRADHQTLADGGQRVIIRVLNKPGIPFQQIDPGLDLNYGQNF